LADWNDTKWIKRQVKKQKRWVEAGAFDPFSYFGAISIPTIGPEEVPAHPRIEEIFMDPRKKRAV
jgi:hypothetical protein